MYVNFWKQYLDFYGKTDRAGFWIPTLINVFLIPFILVMLGYVTLGLGDILLAIFQLAIVIPSFAIMVRRVR
ncbi:MAG: DUF805 domain-containing protein, partial [Psittacicella sp.]